MYSFENSIREHTRQLDNVVNGVYSVADPGFCKGGFIYRLPKAATQRRVAPISPHEAGKFFSPLFFSYQGGLSWHLRALHSKFQM